MRDFGKSIAWGIFYWVRFCLCFVGAVFTVGALSEPLDPEFWLQDLVTTPLATVFWALLAAVTYGVAGVPFFTLVVFVVKKVRKRLKKKPEASGVYSQ